MTSQAGGRVHCRVKRATQLRQAEGREAQRVLREVFPEQETETAAGSHMKRENSPGEKQQGGRERSQPFTQGG